MISERSGEICILPLTADLLDSVAAVHLEAFRGYPNARLGRRYARRFLQWFANCSEGCALVAVDDDRRVLGYVAGAYVGYGRAMNRDLFACVAGQTLLRPWILLNGRFLRAVRAKIRSMLVRQKTEASPAGKGGEPTMSLVAIGTASAMRRAGVGAALMTAFESSSRTMGARSLRLSVYPSNGAARALYERSGWTAGTVPPDDSEAMYYWKALA